jgi:hypothetical protein
MYSDRVRRTLRNSASRTPHCLRKSLNQKAYAESLNMRDRLVADMRPFKRRQAACPTSDAGSPKSDRAYLLTEQASAMWFSMLERHSGRCISIEP